MSMTRIFIVLLIFTSSLVADVKSITGQIKFDTQMDNQAEMTLNSAGLGIGVTPSTNLHVNGNAIVTEQVFVGGSSGSSNLNVNGTIGYGFQTVTSSTTLGQSSTVLVDSSSDNIILTLPYAGNVAGLLFNIKKIASENEVRISSSGNIDNYPELILNSNNSNLPNINLVSDGNKWFILDNFVEEPLGPSSSNLILWLDASDENTLTYDSAGNVLTWLDKSTKQSHLAGVSGEEPSGNAGALNNLNTIYFDGSEYMTISNMDHESSDYTIFVVIKKNKFISSERLFASNNAGDRIILWIGPNLGFFTDTEGNQFSETMNSSTSLISWVLDSSTSSSAKVYVNGVSTGSSNYQLNKSLESTVDFGSEGGASEITADIGEFIIYDKVLTNSERESIESYLNAKWGLSL